MPVLLWAGSVRIFLKMFFPLHNGLNTNPCFTFPVHINYRLDISWRYLYCSPPEHWFSMLLASRPSYGRQTCNDLPPQRNRICRHSFAKKWWPCHLWSNCAVSTTSLPPPWSLHSASSIPSPSPPSWPSPLHATMHCQKAWKTRQKTFIIVQQPLKKYNKAPIFPTFKFTVTAHVSWTQHHLWSSLASSLVEIWTCTCPDQEMQTRNDCGHWGWQAAETILGAGPSWMAAAPDLPLWWHSPAFSWTCHRQVIASWEALGSWPSACLCAWLMPSSCPQHAASSAPPHRRGPSGLRRRCQVWGAAALAGRYSRPENIFGIRKKSLLNRS